MRGVTLRFTGLIALNNVSFEVEPGSIHAVIGPNGAGKSSLFNVLSGLYRPQEGSIRLDDTEQIGRRPHQIARMGVGRAFQNASMFNDLTVRDHLLIGQHRFGRAGALAAGLQTRAVRRHEADAGAVAVEVAEYFGLTSHLDDEAAALPYGIQKRVDLARAVATSPNLLLLDEPVAGLHTHEKAEMGELIRRLAADRDLTVLLVEHDMPLVMRIAETLTVLNFGTCIATGDPAAVARDKAVIAAYLGSSSMEEPA